MTLPFPILLFSITLARDASTGRVLPILLVASLFIVVMLVILIRLSRSIRQLRESASRLAQGDLSQRVDIAAPLQLSALADSLNQMARQLQDRLDALTQQRNEMGAVLWSMMEAVLAVDTEAHIINLNRAAADLLHIDSAHAIGRPLQEVVRNQALQLFVAQTLEDDQPHQTELTLNQSSDVTDTRQLQAQSAILRDSNGRRIGAVLVLHDATQLRRLEVVRRDFVANVSHEVKTPVSAIKAAVETLLSDDEPDAQTRRQFLGIISRQSDRLAAIVDDLLSLARIEQEDETGRVRAELQRRPIAQVLSAAAETCQAHAREKRITLTLACSPALEAQVNPPLLEQAMVNLADNAIKYSPPNTEVTLSAQQAEQEVVLTVSDEGRGIEPERPAAHLRAVLSHGQSAQPIAWRHRAGPVHRQTRRSGPRRPRHCQ